MLSKSGIYQIRNTVNGKIYVGSSKNLRKRKTQHVGSLNKGTHYAKELQAEWTAAPDTFVFESLIYCPQSLLHWYEQQFIDQWAPEYNNSPYAGLTHKGLRHSDKTKAQISRAKTGTKLSDETRAAMSRRMQGPNNPRRGAHHSDKTRELLRAANIGKVLTPEHRSKMVEAQKARRAREREARGVS